MKHRKFLLIIGIAALLLFFALNTSFAASSEKTTKYKEYSWEISNKKIVKINHFEVSNEKHDSKSSYKISIKKYYRNKYKIKSVNLKYYDFDKETNNYFYKNYTIKNKNSITIKDPKKNLSLQKMTIIYQTKNKIKNESYSYPLSGTWKRTTYYYGKTFKGVLKQNGYIIKEYGCDGGVGPGHVETRNKLKISSKNKKSKIDKVKLYFLGGHAGHLERTKIYKAYGKNSLTRYSWGNYEASYLYYFRVYYR